MKQFAISLIAMLTLSDDSEKTEAQLKGSLGKILEHSTATEAVEAGFDGDVEEVKLTVNEGNFDQAKSIIKYLLHMDMKAGKFSKPERCDERAADYAQDLAAYFGVTGELDDENPDYEEIYAAAMEASAEAWPTDPPQA